ncbi:MAG: hypothetical protein QG635_806 [Bacteroidota bacterium]|nr:hypothetical protein [Bacteroidota bacterium]
MRLILIFLVLIAASSEAFSQIILPQDEYLTIILKNNTKYNAIYQKQDGKSVLFKNENEELFTVSIDDIKFIKDDDGKIIYASSDWKTPDEVRELNTKAEAIEKGRILSNEEKAKKKAINDSLKPKIIEQKKAKAEKKREEKRRYDSSLSVIQRLWFEFGIGMGYDKNFFDDFSSLFAFRPAISYQYSFIKLTARFLWMPGFDSFWDECHPKRTVRDYGLLAGFQYDMKFFSVSFSGGVSYQEGNVHGRSLGKNIENSYNSYKSNKIIEQNDWNLPSSDSYYYENQRLSNLNIPIELQVLGTYLTKHVGGGLLLFFNINPVCNSWGFQIFFGGGYSNLKRK